MYGLKSVSNRVRILGGYATFVVSLFIVVTVGLCLR